MSGAPTTATPASQRNRRREAQGQRADLMLRPNVGIFRTLDFPQASAILRAAEPVKAEVKEKLG
jgi:hypothetical protein